MRRRLPTLTHGLRLAFLLCATLVLLGHLGIRPGALGGADVDTQAASPCDDCPCEEGSGVSSSVVELSGAESDCPEGNSGQCPLDCSHCSCCAGGALAVTPDLASGPPAQLIEGAFDVLYEAPPNGFLGRIFRPPQASLV